MTGATSASQNHMQISTMSAGSPAIMNQGSTDYWANWILYTVPGSAFLLGLGLFLLVLKTQPRRRVEANEIGCDRGKQAKQSLDGIISCSLDTGVALQKAKSAETLSYENVETGIYESQDALTQFNVDDQEVYILPDEIHNGTQGNFNTHHAAQPLTESDSYENMVCSLYARTIKEQPFEGNNEDAESYIDMDPQQEMHPDFCSKEEAGEGHLHHIRAK
ncbi:uncharacterized protein LOC125718226 isoform X2 [Brienomyrus brachyistius]|uniref:uncharacterized protein LOC125718226 isoform X2 n=1 Tax=Brienomyrus brachyistius TaxID=42636 RepID=UPI0020B2A013|nr:uncharacterized protein LOC125718226 isoform X2 [Brienomyrus brachyistius]